MKQRAMRDYIQAWRRLSPQKRQQAIGFVLGALVAAIVLRLVGW
jgi:hypothetical protein